MSRRTISVVIPSFNEERSVQEMVDRLTAVFRDELPQYDYEIIFVDDFSTDGTRAEIRRIAQEDPRVKAILNARNFGFHRNVFSALTYGSGDATFMLFGDLQDPPENLPEFVRAWESGKQVVIGQRRSSDEGFVMTGLRHLYYAVIRVVLRHERRSLVSRATASTIASSCASSTRSTTFSPSSRRSSPSTGSTSKSSSTTRPRARAASRTSTF